MRQLLWSKATITYRHDGLGTPICLRKNSSKDCRNALPAYHSIGFFTITTTVAMAAKKAGIPSSAHSLNACKYSGGRG